MTKKLSLIFLAIFSAHASAQTYENATFKTINLLESGSQGDASGLSVSPSGLTDTTPQTLGQRAAQRLSIADCGGLKTGDNLNAYSTCLTKLSNAGGGVLWFPSGYPLGANTLPIPTNITVEFDGPNINRSVNGMGTATDAGKVFSGRLGTTRPSGNNRAGVSMIYKAEGSGKNVASNGDFALQLRVEKENYNCTPERFSSKQCSAVAKQGEIDTIFLTAFNGGPDSSSNPDLKSATGSTQHDAYPLTKQVTHFNTVPNGTGAILNLNMRGPITIYNTGSNTLKLYPPAQSSIATLEINSAYTLPANETTV